MLKKMRGLKGIKEKIIEFKEKIRRESKEQGMSVSKKMKKLRREVREMKDREVR